MRKINIIFILVFAFLCACSQNERFENTNFESRWENLPVKVFIENEFQQEAVDYYNNLFGGVTFFESSSYQEAQIVFSKFKFSEQDGIDGFTAVDFDKNDFIVFSEILINEKRWESTVSVKLIAHELMHALGRGEHDSNGLMKENFVGLGFSLDELFGDNLRQWLIETYELDVSY